jgi:tetratricopeptide (TPR) repeat protein/tRNA A-37 threonylcarbamoyl transferase component Bud32
MPAALESGNDHGREGSTRWAQVLDQFEDAWQRGQCPSIDDYLPMSGAERRAVLVELVHVDLERRLKGGEPVRVEQYLEQYTELTERSEDVLLLIVAEFRLRLRHEANLPVEEFLQRFPQYRAELQARLHPDATPTGSRYHPLRFHARGGLGEVLVAHDDELHREVALKRVQAAHAHDASSRRRFLQEAEITGRLQHPGVVPVYGLVHDAQGQPSYAMRFIEGESLREALERFHEADRPGRDPGQRSLDLRQLLTRFVAVCNTVAFAHSRGIVHRDLKPQNVMLGKFGETLVVDWGLAKPFDRTQDQRAAGEETLRPAATTSSENTQAGATLGTPAYMSPEQAEGRWDAVGAASDVYSLGATLYALLTGQPPFQGRNPDEILVRVRRGEFAPPRQVKPHVPLALEAVCLRAMAHDPDKRYATATALAQDVERWLADEPVTVYRERLRGRLQRWARRRRTLVASAAVAILLLVAAGVAGLFLWQVMEQRQHEAERRHEQQTQVYREKLWLDTLASERLGLTELHNGHFDNASTILRQAVEHLDKEARVVTGHTELADLRMNLADKLQRAERLVQFYARSDDAERIVAESFDSRELHGDREGLANCESGLKALGVFEHEQWWKALPDADLEEHQRRQLQKDVYRQLLFLGCMRGKAGLKNFMAATDPVAFRAALDAVAAVKRYHPSSSTAGILEIACHFKLGQFDQMRTMPRSEPDTAADYYFVGMLHTWIAHAPKDPITQVALRTMEKMMNLDFQTPLRTAEQYLRTAATLEPKHYWTHLWLGFTLVSANKPDAAELAFDTCVGLRPDLMIGYGLRALTLRNQIQKTTDSRGRAQFVSRAFTGLNAALKVNPNDGRAHAWRGIAYLHERAYDDALKDFNEAIRLEPRYPPAHQGRGSAYQAKGDFDHAIEDFTEAIRLDSRFFVIFRTRGYLLAQLGRWEKAEEDYTRALRMEPVDANVWHEAALLHLRRGNAAGFRQVCKGMWQHLRASKDALRIAAVVNTCAARPDSGVDPGQLAAKAEALLANDTSRVALEALGIALYRAGRYPQAMDRLEAAARAPSGEASIWGPLFLAMAQRHSGQTKQARANLALAVKQFDNLAADKKAFNWVIAAKWEHLHAEAAALLRDPAAAGEEPGKAPAKGAVTPPAPP